MLQCQLTMKFQRSKHTESILEPFYNIPPLLGSVPVVLASPDTEIPPQNLSVATILPWHFLHEQILQSGPKSNVDQLLTHRICPPNFPSIVVFLHVLIIQQNLSIYVLFSLIICPAFVRSTEIHAAMPIIHGIPSFQVHKIHLGPLLQYSPDPGALPTCSDIFRYRNRAKNSPQSTKSRKHLSPSIHGPIGS